MSTATASKPARLHNCPLRAVRSWGKHVLLEFGGSSVRNDCLLFGNWRIDKAKHAAPW